MAAAAIPDRDYDELLARLYAARRFGMKLELDRMVRCLDRLGRPQDRFSAVAQIGGTNGKGSTSAFTESILRAAGWRTALYTSPHLSRLSERFRVGGAELPSSVLLEADRAVERAASSLGLDLTFFERLTAMAVWAFAEEGVEVPVLEVGLGGRLDATTAIGAGVAAVTGVALDHQEHLGATLAAIASEKAGIFRAGQRAVVGASGEPEAVPQLVAEARRAGVESLTVIDGDAIAAVPGRLGLRGPHQRANAACALAVTAHLGARLGRPAPDDAVKRGLADCRLPGRMETIASSPAVIVDGAHNPQAAAALAAALTELPAARWILVLGASRDKDAAAIAAALRPAVAEVVTTASRSERAYDPDALAAAVRAGAPGLPVTTAPDVTAALAIAVDRAGPDGAILVAGSLFLAGEARELLLGEPADPRPTTDPLP